MFLDLDADFDEDISLVAVVVEVVVAAEGVDVEGLPLAFPLWLLESPL